MKKKELLKKECAKIKYKSVLPVMLCFFFLIIKGLMEYGVKKGK